MSSAFGLRSLISGDFGLSTNSFLSSANGWFSIIENDLSRSWPGDKAILYFLLPRSFIFLSKNNLDFSIFITFMYVVFTSEWYVTTKSNRGSLSSKNLTNTNFSVSGSLYYAMQNEVIFSCLASFGDYIFLFYEKVDTVRFWFFRFKVLSIRLSFGVESRWKVTFDWLSAKIFFLSRRGVDIGLFDLLLVNVLSMSFWPSMFEKKARTFISF